MTPPEASVCLFQGGEVSSGSEHAWEGAQRSFCAAPGGSQAEWDLRFAKAPDGSSVAVVMDAEGRVVSRILGTRHQAVLDGQTVFFIEVSDLYNDFERGAGLARTQNLRSCGDAFARSFGGRAPEGHPLIYGVPTRRAHRFGLRRLRWEILRSEALIRVGPHGLRAPVASGVEVEEVGRFPEDVGELSARMAEGRGAMLTRDALRLNHRFCARPGAIKETIAVAKRAGQLVGACVYAAGVLREWIVPHQAMDVAGALCTWGNERARADGQEGLATGFPETSPEWLLFQRLGFWIHGGEAYTVFRSFHKPYVMSWLFHNWYYTPADISRL